MVGKEGIRRIYSEHGLLSCKLGDFGEEFVAFFGREDAGDPGLTFVYDGIKGALEGTGGAAKCFCHARVAGLGIGMVL